MQTAEPPGDQAASTTSGRQAAYSGAGNDWVLFDLDGTIVDHDSMTRFLLHQLVGHPLRALAALVTLPVTGPLLQTRRWRGAASSVFYWLASVGRSDRELAEAAEAYLDRRSVRAQCYPDALQEIAAHLDAGRQVAVVTASGEWLAKPLCARIDPRLHVAGTRTRRSAVGLVVDHYAYGSAKLPAVAQVIGPGDGAAGRITAAYSDSLTDLPMLDLAEQMVWVNLTAAQKRRLSTTAAHRCRSQFVTWHSE